jgi:hypothetical protein
MKAIRTTLVLATLPAFRAFLVPPPPFLPAAALWSDFGSFADIDDLDYEDTSPLAQGDYALEGDDPFDKAAVGATIPGPTILGGDAGEPAKGG